MDKIKGCVGNAEKKQMTKLTLGQPVYSVLPICTVAKIVAFMIKMLIMNAMKR
ncbi:MAG: hypothetical protein ACRC4W_04195 [Treponemataceae bacterium]